MKPNLRIGLLLSNHHPEVEDDVALELILGAIVKTVLWLLIHVLFGAGGNIQVGHEGR